MGENFYYEVLDDIVVNDPEYLKVMFNKKEKIRYLSTEIPHHYHNLQERICENARDFLRFSGSIRDSLTESASNVSSIILEIFADPDYAKTMKKMGIVTPGKCYYTNLNPFNLELEKW